MKASQPLKPDDKIDYWRDLFLEWGNSQKTIKHFCKEQSIPIARFSYWRKRLRNLKHSASN